MGVVETPDADSFPAESLKTAFCPANRPKSDRPQILALPMTGAPG